MSSPYLVHITIKADGFITVGELLKTIPENIGEQIIRQDFPDIDWDEAPAHALENNIEIYAEPWREQLERAIKDGKLEVFASTTKLPTKQANADDLVSVDSVIEWAKSYRVKIEISAKNTITAELNCNDWLSDLMRENSRPEKPKREYLADAKEKFPGISARSFTRAWGNATTKTANNNWKKPGRKS